MTYCPGTYSLTMYGPLVAGDLNTIRDAMRKIGSHELERMVDRSHYGTRSLNGDGMSSATAIM